MKKNQDYCLKVGEEETIFDGLLSKKTEIVYAGMINPEVFSIAVRESAGYAAWAYNLYFPKSQTEIHLEKKHLHVQQVTPEEIILQYIQ